MSLALHELLLCCRHLENDKATERKREIEKFKRLLRDSETVQHLDRNSDARHGKLNWDIVFRFLQKYIQKEIESLKLAKANVSSATQASRHKKMQELSSLVKYFIRCANQRAPRLKCQELLSHVMYTVTDSMSRASFGADYSSILLKDILSVRKYWCEIQQQQWTEMLTLYFRLYLEPSSDINRVLLARIIHTLVKGCCLQTDGLTSELFDFFSKAMQHAKQERNLVGLEQILAALNTFLCMSAANCRMRVCRVGEEILPIVLYIWAQCRPKDSLKEEIIEFLQLQLHVHHPKGAKSQDKGAYAYDSVKWQKILQALYEILVNEINQIGSRGKYSSGSRHIAVKENLVELTSDICHQLFTEDTRVLEIAHLSFVAQRESLDGPTPSKRRRIELGWEVVRENLQRSHNDFDVIPWLQITACLIAKYPESFPNSELVLIITVLHQLLSQQRRGERAPYVLKCLTEVAICQNQKMDLKTTYKLDLQKLWTKIWAITLRSISSQQTEAESFGLLEAIIRGGLVHIDRDLWKIFSGAGCKPSSPAVHCLALVLTACTLPENLKIEMETCVCEGNRGYTLKELIIQWLLSYQLNEDMEENPEPPTIICRDFPHLVLQKILVSLTMKDCNAAMRFFQNMTECVQHKKRGGNVCVSEIEELYLLTTFDEITLCMSPAVKIADRKLATSSLIVNHNLKENLEQWLVAVSEQLLNSYSCETTCAENLVRCASLLTGVLGYYCCAGILTEEEACQSELFQKAKSLMHYVGESVSMIKTKLTEETKIISLRNLIIQCTNCICNYTKNSLSRIISDLHLRLLTSRMLNELADICKHLVACTRTPSDSVEIDFLEDDHEESRMEVESLPTMDLFDDDDDTQDMNDVNETGELQSITGAVSPLAEEHLTKQDMLLLDILRFLSLCVTGAQFHSVSFRAPDIRKKLLSFINSSTLDITKSLQLKVYLTLLKELPIKENLLPVEDVVMLLKPLPDLCSFYRRDQEVCAAILTHLLPIIASLVQDQTDAEETNNAQGQFLTIIQAFWHLRKEGKCTVPVRMALMNCIKALLEADPHAAWAVLTIDNENVPVSDVVPQFLTDSHHQVRMLAAKSVNRLFQDVRTQDSSGFVQALPLKLQQKAFENVYMKVQEGMKYLSCARPEELPDEQCNRKATLLMVVSMILCCSPVCEKQALFAIYQSVKENGLEPELVKKVFKGVSATLGYKSIKDFMTSHLDYLVLEWLRLTNPGYNLSAFPYVLLNYSDLEEFYRSCYKVLIPHLVIRSDFEEVKSLARQIQKDWRLLLADCFPKILVNILPYFAYQAAGDSNMAQLRDVASMVYDKLKEEDCLGKQQIDNLFLSNLPDIIVELLMTLHETSSPEIGQGTELIKFAGELDPAPNPPCFPSYVIKATLDYISSCHKSKLKNLVAILSKNPDSFQKILLAICKQAAETNNTYKKHRILLIYYLFVNLLLKEIKDGLGGAWAFVLRDVIYTLIHHINSRPSLVMDDVSVRSTLLCCDLLNLICQTAVMYCGDALESHLHVIVGSLISLVGDRREIQQQVIDLLKYLIIENKDNENLYHTIQLLDPLPDHPVFKDMRVAQQSIKYSRGPFSLLEEINHFLSVSVCDSLPLTRLEGLNDLRKQLAQHKDQMKQLVKEFQENPQDNVIVKLVVSLLQQSKTAAHHLSGKEVLEAVGSCLGELGPIELCTITLQHNKDATYSRAVDLFQDKELQWIFIILNLINNVLTDHCVQVRSAAATCLKNVLATKSGSRFWEAYKDKTDPLLVYLQPYRVSKKKFIEESDVEIKEPPESLDDCCLWVPQSKGHDSWIKSLACTLLDSGGVKSEVLRLLRPMCEVQTDFCQTVLPYLIHSILLQDPDDSWRTLVSRHIQGFFSTCCRSSSSSSRSTTPANSDSEPEFLVLGCLDIISRRTMLGVVDYLRRQKRPLPRTIFDDNFWLELNYLEVAITAQSCAAHFTALLYAEIYADKIKLEEEERKSKTASTLCRSLTFEEGSQSLTIASLSEKSKEESGISLQDLLMEIYRSIGEPDSLYGCGGGKMLQPLARIRTYEHEAMWGKALVTYDLEMNLPPATRQAGIIQALQNFGLCHTLSTYLKGLEHENAEWGEELQEMRYQAAWRNMQWDHSPSIKNEVVGPGYHESLYSALQSLRDREFCSFYENLKYARIKEVEDLCRGSLESVYSLYPTLCRLQTLAELENVGQLLSRPVTDQELKEIYIKWQRQSHLLKDSDFSFQEPIMALRTVILEILLEKETENSKRECIKDILTKHLVELSTLARTARNTQLPERAIFQIKQYNPAHFQISEWQLEEAKVFWAKKEQSLALGILKQMIDKLNTVWSKEEKDPTLQLIFGECLRLCGNWLAETCLESPTVIMQMYLEEAVKVAESHNGRSNSELQSGKMKAFLSLARFSDAQYQRIENYMKSSEFDNKQALLKKAKDEVLLIKEYKVQTNRYTVKVQRELELDEFAIASLKEDRQSFLCRAIENYISCLVCGEEHDMWIFRLCSLWLENHLVFEVNDMMKQGAQKIPSYKFLPLMYQLAARMGTKKTEELKFHEVLNDLITRISMDHPYHTLFIILALANANKDDLLSKPEANKRNRLSKNAPKQISELDKDRKEAACNIVNIIKHRRPEMVRDIERLCDAYIILANMDASHWKAQRKGISIPTDQPILKLKDLNEVVIPTMEVKVDLTGDYENLVTIRSFKSEFRLAGGVNLPKIIDCIGSDGKERRQLVKGRDDLRQDAVMQQVFQMCNLLLHRNTETRKRKLTIRTYKVIPLSQRSGVLEWCTGTLPIGEYLVNSEDGAHKRYRPNDYSSFQCQKKMAEVQRGRPEDKCQAYLDICQHFRPVFRYFCMEKFLDPAVWFEKRLAYTRSVATSSIVCYIVGLGDRHVQNILIDEETAELVHIDLGVAFEQGRILPTPETVPFRLTRDIVDGMGITGVEGVFRRCCERTMEVMRTSQEALLTIVEVLLYDPLFDWTMNPLKAMYLQQDEADLNATLPGDNPECNGKDRNSDQSFNKVAERVLLRLQEKLKGVEEGTVLSVGGQVNLLIQQAMDPKNLSRLYPGWKPWI
ncbi:serine-protein kinase ATM [Rhinatrema bivittatum]|uniref:serine-protein kinase ATM n=1 Tax=Rhinatrema bivittatum TaxID=194408 RepID=UPI00112D2EB2|nr:serine-protein kinase ATM [Rhinatrema bivittatum]